MTTPAPTTSSVPMLPADAAAVPAPAPAAPATEPAPAPRARGPLGRLLARRARLKATTAPVAPPTEAVPNTPSAPDVWLAGLRLGS
ncbi:hypothetical protein ACWC3X_07860 [Streptomyces populi]|jgi:hypothetical protein